MSKRDNHNNKEYIYEMMYKVHKKVMIILAFFIISVSLVGFTVNYFERPEEIRALVTSFTFRMITLLLIYLIHYIAKKKNMSKEFMGSFMGIMTVVLFYQIFYFSFRLNYLLYTAIVFGLVYTIFITDIKLVVSFQIIGYLLVFYRMYKGDFSDFILPQSITAIGIIIVATLTFYNIRQVLYNLLFFLSESNMELKESNNELEEIKNELEIRVVERTNELEEANTELEASNIELAKVLEALKDSQEELLLSASMESYLKLSKGISHQINTPLGVANTSITYIYNIISRQKADLKNKKYNPIAFMDQLEETTNLVEKSINRSIDVINILDNFKNYEQFQHTKLSELLRKLDFELYAYEIYRGTRINIDYNFECDLFIPIDTFVTILRSFFDNSLQNNNHDNLQIELKAVNHDTFIQLIISDNGEGVPPEFSDKIFQPYSSMSPHRLGMGMFIAYSYITLTMNGSLVVDKSYTEGARFIITIPKEKLHKKP